MWSWGHPFAPLSRSIWVVALVVFVQLNLGLCGKKHKTRLDLYVIRAETGCSLFSPIHSKEIDMPVTTQEVYTR
jgi:hypothetical protein